MLPSADYWTDRLRYTLGGYDEGLLRQVSNRLCKPRSHWPVQELVDRCLSAIGNPAVLDRRLKDLPSASRSLLALIGHSRQPRWHVGSLVEMMAVLGQNDGLQPVVDLFEAGLLYPELPVGDKARPTRLKKFEHWLTQGSAGPVWVYAHPAASVRALDTDLGLPECPGVVRLVGAGSGRSKDDNPAVHEADGLEWPLRLTVLWQQVANASLRRTQQRDFFKRDLERLRGDPLLSAAPADNLSDVPDPGLLAVAMALSAGLIQDRDGELIAGTFPAVWQEGLPAALAGLWSALPHLESWNTANGWQPATTPGNPFPSAYLLSLLLLKNLPAGSWARPEAVVRWVVEHHPYWKSAAEPARNAQPKGNVPSAPVLGLTRFVLGLAYQLRMVQAVREPKGDWLVRLSPMGWWLLGLGEAPAALAVVPQTLLVQPNLEILVYRQGLTPELIARLGRFAAWKSLGAACTLQLEPATVYRALESGETMQTLVQTLERHSMKAMPSPVIEALRTWSNKRDRISVYPAGALFEFSTAADLQEALARGLQAVRLGENLAVVADESAIDYRHFRLTGTRDYCLPPEKCVAVEADGVTLSVDLARSDLLLETELQRFAEVVSGGVEGRRRYRLTPATLALGKQNGLSVLALESWFFQRCGQALSAAARLLLTAAETPPLHLQRQLVLNVASEEIADGLQQWPGTRDLLHDRLGPTALVVLEENAATLAERLQALGMTLQVKDEP